MSRKLLHPGLAQRIRLALANEPQASHAALARRLGCTVADIEEADRPRHHTPPRTGSLAASTDWLDQPPGRIKAQRKAEGLDDA